MPIENDGTWNMYRDIVAQCPELEEDLRRLHSVVTNAEDYYWEIREMYCDLPGWEFLDAQVSMVFAFNTEILPGVMPGEAEKPESYSPNKLIREYLPHLVERKQ